MQRDFYYKQLTLKDYAPYFRRKEEFKQQMQDLKVIIDRSLFLITLTICALVLIRPF